MPPERIDITKAEAHGIENFLTEETWIKSGSTGTPRDRGYGFGGYAYNIFKITPDLENYLKSKGVWGQRNLGVDMGTYFATYTIDYDKNTIKVMGIA